MISGIDRHRLRAVSPELEARYQQTVQTATALVSPHKLSHLQVHSVLSSKRAASPVANGNANANGHGNNKKKSSADGRKYVCVRCVSFHVCRVYAACVCRVVCVCMRCVSCRVVCVCVC